MTEYAAPLRSKPVDQIETADVLTVLKPLWTKTSETASRLRGRIEKVLNAAKAKGYRTGENPAAWRGHLENLLPKQSRLLRGHYAAMAYEDIPAFVARLREREAVSTLAIEFAILTAARSGEVLGARWSEIDLEAKVWVIPAGRMKAAREHRVPLSDPAMAILTKLGAIRMSEFVFPGNRRNTPLSPTAMDMVLRRMGVEATIHGMRSAFRDFCGNETHFRREIAEHALAHAAGDRTEQAYRRDDALAKRRDLMDAWGAFCEPRQGGNVIQLGRRA
jgi:integrase